MFRHDVVDSTAFLITTGHRAGGEAAAIRKASVRSFFPRSANPEIRTAGPFPMTNGPCRLNVSHHFN